MIGDRMDTDVVAGLEAGLHTVLVLTGVTQREEAERFPYRPSRIVDSSPTWSTRWGSPHPGSWDSSSWPPAQAGDGPG